MARSRKASARSLALDILDRLSRGKGFATELLDVSFEEHGLLPVDRKLATQLVLGVLRERGFLDGVLGKFVSLSKTSKRVLEILRLGAFQLFFLNRIPARAAIFESVELAKREGEAIGKLVNAVLRRVLEGAGEELGARKAVLDLLEEGKVSSVDFKALSAALSFPRWILQRWAGILSSSELIAQASYFNQTPPHFLRVNVARQPVSEVEAIFQTRDLPFEMVPGTPFLKLLRNAQAVVEPLLREGRISRQDLGSYRVVQALGARPGEIGLDACAGHGGKSSAVVEALVGELKLFVHDPSATRLKELVGNFGRLGLKVPEILRSSKEAKGRNLSFDWILVDAPCSGMGTLGRKPEIRWRIRTEDLLAHQKIQRGILEEWLPLLKPGGRLVYAVCSNEPEEGEAVISQPQKFQTEENEFQTEEVLNLWPCRTRHDGFFVGQLRRTE